METIIPTLTSLLAQSPVFIVWLVALVLAIARWQRHPNVSLFTTLALVGFLVVSIIDTYLNVSLPIMLIEQGQSASQVGVMFAVKGVVSAVIRAVLWGVLIAAVFIGRDG